MIRAICNTFAAALLLSLSACSGSSPAGSTSGSTPPGSTGDGVVWKDATGKLVEGVVDDPPLYFDPAGHIWRVDQFTAEVSVDLSGGNSLITVFQSPDCTGTALLLETESGGVPEPRVTFQIQGDPTIRVRPDTTPDMMASAC
jgi:hypothetical protein